MSMATPRRSEAEFKTQVEQDTTVLGGCVCDSSQELKYLPKPFGMMLSDCRLSDCRHHSAQWSPVQWQNCPKSFLCPLSATLCTSQLAAFVHCHGDFVQVDLDQCPVEYPILIQNAANNLVLALLN